MDNFSWQGSWCFAFDSVGGVGMMTIYASMTILLGKAFGMREPSGDAGIVKFSAKRGFWR